ncbi:IS66 family transposase zinc-finger binding domain-containing protein [Bradyrhizobium sp. 6(2017)]|nr:MULTISPECIES: IS66 family transposase zinc-finger binding domain-containing protein [Bradyrhizobium]UGY12333.1 IS66 family transposase zinc-finger binding domain-containing protein [Bradyrhizobium septentrionale]
MSIAALRDENEQLKALLAQTQAALSEHQAALATSEESRRRLEVILGELRREKFGATSEKLRPDQYHLPLEDVEIAQGILDAAQERAEAVIKGRSRSVPDQGSHRNRGCLPAHLPRVERIIELASTLCPCGCGAMTKIGEDVSKRLDVIPAQWRCWSRAARNTSVATARALSCRRAHRSASCPAGCRPKRPLRT